MHKSNLINLSRAGIISVVVLSVFTSACGALDPVPTPTTIEYQLAATSVDAGSCKANPSKAILQVTEVKADAPFNTNKMYYSQAQYQINSYTLNQWATRPSSMLTQQIQEKLLASCIYGNVVNSEFMTTAKYRLNSQLLDYKQVMNGQSSSMKLSILVQLVDNTSNQVVRSKIFNNEAAGDPTVGGYVKGANEVTQSFLNDLVTWLASNNN